jgi:hypothetical protein
MNKFRQTTVAEIVEKTFFFLIKNNSCKQSSISVFDLFSNYFKKKKYYIRIEGKKERIKRQDGDKITSLYTM